jgi:hypothetical protein
MGWMVLYEGTRQHPEDAYIFPAFSVKANDFILVHFKPQGLEIEKNESMGKDLSGGLDASAEAFDFWVKGGDGLSSNNGVLALYTNPSGLLVDGVLYSNRTSYSDTLYRGFGSPEMLEKALDLQADKGWKAESEEIRPEDGINPENSTSTRSLCRKPGVDTDTKADWYVVPTKQASFGKENSEEVYIKPARSRSRS